MTDTFAYPVVWGIWDFAAGRGVGLIDFLVVSYYIFLMGPEIIYVPSAFKHGVTEADIFHAYKTLIYDFPLEVHVDKWVFIGFNCAGNPIEVFYNPIGENTIKVFHAMDCQNKTIDQIKR